MTTKKKTTAAAAPKAKAAPPKPEPIAEIKIDDGVPIPQVATGRSKYPFEALRAGQSFLVPAVDMKKMQANLRGAARRVEKATGRSFLVLARPEEKGVRVWRLANQEEEPEQRECRPDDYRPAEASEQEAPPHEFGQPTDDAFPFEEIADE